MSHLDDRDSFRPRLQRLYDTLIMCGDDIAARRVREALCGSDQAVDAFLVSDDLWGGSGSIADQGAGSDREHKRSVESTLIDLGEAQVRAKRTNIRTTMWIDAFRSWRDQGL